MVPHFREELIFFSTTEFAASFPLNASQCNPMFVFILKVVSYVPTFSRGCPSFQI
jgi:hypothetical protein